MTGLKPLCCPTLILVFVILIILIILVIIWAACHVAALDRFSDESTGGDGEQNQ